MLRPLAAATAATAAAVTLSLTMPAQASGPAAAALAGTSVKGTWTGIVNDDTGATKPYQVTVQITRSKRSGDLKATVEYPYCSGHWTYLRTKNGSTQIFTETITRDPGIKSCVSKLRVKAKRTRAGNLYVRWIYHQRTDHMIAQRTT